MWGDVEHVACAKDVLADVEETESIITSVRGGGSGGSKARGEILVMLGDAMEGLGVWGQARRCSSCLVWDHTRR